MDFGHIETRDHQLEKKGVGLCIDQCRLHTDSRKMTSSYAPTDHLESHSRRYIFYVLYILNYVRGTKYRPWRRWNQVPPASLSLAQWVARWPRDVSVVGSIFSFFLSNFFPYNMRLIQQKHFSDLFHTSAYLKNSHFSFIQYNTIL